MVMLWVSHIMILLYRTTHPRIYLRITKWDTLKKLLISLVLFPLVVVHIVIYCAALPY